MEDVKVLRVDISTDENDGSAEAGEGLSLRDAILIANSTPEDEVIELASEQTYTLSIEGEDPNQSFDDEDIDPTTIGDLDLAVNSGKLTIRGLGAGATIDANEINRALQVNGGFGDDETPAALVLENITITRGKAAIEDGLRDEGGGAILIKERASAELIDCTITDNSAPVFDTGDVELEQNGGGIGNQGTLTLTNCTIENNAANNGGGISTTGEGVTTIIDSAISNNTADFNGGGIHNQFEAITDITGSTITVNTSGSRGGGVFGRGFSDDSSVSITDSTVKDNNSGSGGGVFIDLIGFFTIENTVIENNTANDGGGINIDSGLDAVLKLNNLTVQNNQATNDGGGIRKEGTADITLRDSIVRGNNASGSGGGIHANSTGFNLENSTIENNIANTNGGGVYDIDFIRNSTIKNNQTNGFGGGLYLFSSSVILDSTISGNQSDLDGGGVFINGAGRSGAKPVAISNSTISGNTTKNSGGGIAVNALLVNGDDLFNAEGELFATNVTITNNLADSDNNGEGDGGGIDNFPSNSIGGAFSLSGKVTLRNSILAGNFDTPENTGEGDIQPDISGAAKGNANNLVGNLTGLTLEERVASETQSLGQGTDIVNNNPGLGALQDNGGGTPTHALLSVSLAIDAGNNENIPQEAFVYENGESTTIDFNGDGDTNDAIETDQREGEFSRIFGGTVDIGAYEVQENEPEPEPEPEPNPTPDPDPNPDGDDLLDTNIFRFQNNDVPGTYIYVGDEEAQNIRDNFDNFTEEGFAFQVAVEPNDDLIPLYRFQSTVNPGTYLFAGESERADIQENFADSFTEEGLAFYVYGADSGLGTDFSRFQNSAQPGTYLFATGEERANIRENFPNFEEEGIAFAVEI